MFLPPKALKALSLTLLACVVSLGVARSTAGEVQLLDLQGSMVSPFADKHAKLFAFIFVRTDCPISNSYAPRIRQLHDKYAARGVVFRLVYPTTDESPSVIQQHLSEYNYPCAALRDPDSHFAKEAKVRVTPEAAVFRADGTLVYHGRIDDRYADLGKARPKATRHEFADAIASALAGKPVAPAAGPAVGCFIEDISE